MTLTRIFSTVLLLAASAVWANDKLPVTNNTYGTTGLTWVTLTPWDFHPADSSTTYGYTATGTPTFGIYNTGGTGFFEAGLHLPEGALVSVIELAACDTNATWDLFADFRAELKTAGPGNAQGVAHTTGSTGCQVVSSAFAPWTVNNDTTY